ncbi:enoyl-CoA hydratase/isomerase family protein [Verminephrobacter aporrectodeae subsp. tuberculatae]|uniref:enoyl-CoA hydratase/isomerase family protein n=1 Tax=Verminephrobacter aporrectodeae TaxID=1110389 RepID=UPI002243CD5B|nr:enoyl-CoA hydratase/isomerase family protein [Verminephrobacter aporrectodeae]MCW8206579.1 enoyl-CoA hydratase/isomerase family protein [Verminephrobacter aporrectodeae subsp. tuberculatae]
MGQIIVQRSAHVLTLELSNPGKANALDRDMLAQLDAQLAHAHGDENVRALVLRGQRGGAFSSGADIREWAPMRPEEFARDWIGYGNALFDRFESLRCPTIAAIEGLCFGGGLELALCADLRVASHAARFRFPELTLGAIPGWHGGPRLARLVGRGRALEAVLTAGEIDAGTAQAWGLVNSACATESFERDLQALVDRLTRVSPRAAALAKAAIVGAQDPAAFYPAATLALRGSPDAEIGIRAFHNKTAAVF